MPRANLRFESRDLLAAAGDSYGVPRVNLFSLLVHHAAEP
jgi:hypothetical protein